MAVERILASFKRARHPVGLALLVILASASWGGLNRVMEYRWARDLLGLTPFREVVVTDAQLVPAGLMVRGTYVKVRCQFVPGSVVGYLEYAEGPDHFVPVDTAPRDDMPVLYNHPPSPRAQAWGPWLILRVGTLPVRWAIYISHVCPGEDIPQTNEIAHGAWTGTLPDPPPGLAPAALETTP